MSTQTPDPNQPTSTNLTLEQQFFTVATLATAEKASKEQLLGLYGELLKSYFAQQNYYQALVKHQWGIGNESDKRTTEEERFGEGTDY